MNDGSALAVAVLGVDGVGAAGVVAGGGQRLLTASFADRVVEYLLLPFGEPGSTNLGTVSAAPGVVSIPADVSSVTLNIEHDVRRPVGRAVSIVETGVGIVARFRVVATSAGDDLLAEIDEGLRTGVSVELADAVVRAGRLVSGVLAAAAGVVSPAFPSARAAVVL